MSQIVSVGTIPPCYQCKKEYNLTTHLPHTLNCGHSLCSKCVGHFLSRSPDIPCAECGDLGNPNARSRFISRKVNDVPQNYPLYTIIKENLKWGMCEEHGNPLRIICLEDECRICDDCKHDGKHKTHRTMTMKNMQTKANEKMKTLEEALENLSKYEGCLKLILRQKREAFIETISYRFESLRNFLTLKERQLSNEIDSFFRSEIIKVDNGFGAFSIARKELEKKVSGFRDVFQLDQPLRALKEDITLLTNEFSRDFLGDHVIAFRDTFEKTLTDFTCSLIDQGNTILKVEFPGIELSEKIKPAFLNKDTSSSDHELKVKENGKKSAMRIAVEPSDDVIVICSQERHEPQPLIPLPPQSQSLLQSQVFSQQESQDKMEEEEEEETSNKEINLLDLKDKTKLCFNIQRTMLENEELLALIETRGKLNEIKNLTINVLDKRMNDEEITRFFPFLFWDMRGLESVKMCFHLCGKLTERSYSIFMGNIIPTMYGLKTLEFDLRDTKITDQALETFSKGSLVLLENLETFIMKLNKTPVTDKGILYLFVPMLRMKTFKLDLTGTKATGDILRGFVTRTLETMEELECLELMLSIPSVKDEGVVSLFRGIKGLKELVLNLSCTEITDISVDVFVRETLENVRPRIEILDLNFSNTEVSDNSIEKLLNSLPRLKKFKLNVASSKVTKKIEGTLNENKLLYGKFEEFNIKFEEERSRRIPRRYEM